MSSYTYIYIYASWINLVYLDQNTIQVTEMQFIYMSEMLKQHLA